MAIGLLAMLLWQLVADSTASSLAGASLAADDCSGREDWWNCNPYAPYMTGPAWEKEGEAAVAAVAVHAWWHFQTTVLLAGLAVAAAVVVYKSCARGNVQRFATTVQPPTAGNAVERSGTSMTHSPVHPYTKRRYHSRKYSSPNAISRLIGGD
eukprot:NODE_5427_length_677_cov_34.020701_g5052_i0.p1 GENE.NODE_5427_length_677_cov_34.020701_g5052_i0~~NODE_5427_length_677_cov_34.020701_g5052_i0.p1  ORF type:complete len:153 (+),score=6.66 NODE_5427_length_677_cov_34.020701_g5052_i0:86-544(+)